VQIPISFTLLPNGYKINCTGVSSKHIIIIRLCVIHVGSHWKIQNRRQIKNRRCKN